MSGLLRMQLSNNIGTVLIISSGGLEHNGGIGRQMGYFLADIQRHDVGIRYEVIDSRGPWDLSSAPLHRILALFYLLRAITTSLLINRAARPCLAHVNIAGRGSTVRKVIFATAARAFDLRYLIHVHDYDYAQDFQRRGQVMQALVRRIFRNADKILVLGERDRRAMEELFALPPGRAVILHNAVPDPLAEQRLAQHSQGPCHILFLGQLSARKGVPELLQALATPLLASRAWRATLAGGGPVEAFRAQAHQLGLAEQIDFPGWVDAAAVHRLCAQADILVLPSHGEGLAMSVLEGLAHGLAVVTTPVGAHPEVIEPEISGLFVAPGDVDGLARALARLIDDPTLRARLGQAARRRFLEAFEVRGYAARLVQLHRELLAAPAATARPEVREQVS